MPRPAIYGLITAAVLMIPLAIFWTKDSDTASQRTYAESPLKFTVACEDTVKIALTDATGKKSAWTFDIRDKAKDVEWQVEDNVPSIEIVPKDSTRWPLEERRPKGGGKNSPAKSKVKSNADTGVYSYAIYATCERKDKTRVNVFIDPDMIVW